MANATIRFGGMPTALDVDRLIESLGTLHKGDLVSYERIEEVLKVNRKMARFWTVMHAFRRRLERDHNLLMKAIENTGFEVLSDSKRVDELSRSYTHQIRDLGRTAVRAERTNRQGLPEEKLRTLDHVGRMSAQFRLAAATEAKKLEPPDNKVRPLIARQN